MTNHIEKAPSTLNGRANGCPTNCRTTPTPTSQYGTPSGVHEDKRHQPSAAGVQRCVLRHGTLSHFGHSLSLDTAIMVR